MARTQSRTKARSSSAKRTISKASTQTASKNRATSMAGRGHIYWTQARCQKAADVEALRKRGLTEELALQVAELIQCPWDVVYHYFQRVVVADQLRDETATLHLVMAYIRKKGVPGVPFKGQKWLFARPSGPAAPKRPATQKKKKKKAAPPPETAPAPEGGHVRIAEHCNWALAYDPNLEGVREVLVQAIDRDALCTSGFRQITAVRIDRFYSKATRVESWENRAKWVTKKKIHVEGTLMSVFWMGERMLPAGTQVLFFADNIHKWARWEPVA